MTFDQNRFFTFKKTLKLKENFENLEDSFARSFDT